ncbi:MAG: DinB family protein [Thermoanaerobaculaceae bacterium]|nr:DinB family protein [Thermoanaerobaculaceae bacterium]
MTGSQDLGAASGAPGALEPELEELRARLEADLEALLAAVTPLDQVEADWRPAPERWSAGEVLHHVVLANRTFAIVARKLIQQGRRAGVTAGPQTRRSWPRIRAIAEIGASGPVKNPDRVTPAHGFPIAALCRDLIESHAAVMATIPALAGLDLGALRFPHPLGFELNLYQWVDIAGAHERRHLFQLRTITASPGFPRRTG